MSTTWCNYYCTTVVVVFQVPTYSGFRITRQQQTGYQDHQQNSPWRNKWKDTDIWRNVLDSSQEDPMGRSHPSDGHRQTGVQSLVSQCNSREGGDLLMDTPRRYSWDELCDSAKNKGGWRPRVYFFWHGNGITFTMNKNLPSHKTPRHPSTSTICNPQPTWRESTNSQSSHHPSPSARKYVVRNTHRDRGTHDNPEVQKKKVDENPTSNRQVTSNTYECNHTPQTSPTKPTSPCFPTIWGHQNHSAETLNTTNTGKIQIKSKNLNKWRQFDFSQLYA